MKYHHVTLLALLLTLSLLGNILMFGVAQNARGRLDLVTYTRASSRMVPGEPAPPLAVKTLQGASAMIKAEDSQLPTVLYIFSANCLWCRRNHDSIEALVRAAGSRYRFVAVAMERQDLQSYLKQYPTGAEVFMEPSTETIKTYSLGATPMTIVLNPEGSVQDVWLGAFRGATRAEVARAFSVDLPEFSDNTK